MHMEFIIINNINHEDSYVSNPRDNDISYNIVHIHQSMRLEVIKWLIVGGKLIQALDSVRSNGTLFSNNGICMCIVWNIVFITLNIYPMIIRFIP